MRWRRETNDADETEDGGQVASVGDRVSVPVDQAAIAYRAAQLQRFEEARMRRDLALELNTRSERAMVAAVNEYDEARKAMRRISELDRDR